MWMSGKGVDGTPFNFGRWLNGMLTDAMKELRGVPAQDGLLKLFAEHGARMDYMHVGNIWHKLAVLHKKGALSPRWRTSRT